MAETTGDKPRKQRLFVALDLPDKIRAGVAAWGREELVDPALKPVLAATPAAQHPRRGRRRGAGGAGRPGVEAGAARVTARDARLPRPPRGGRGGGDHRRGPRDRGSDGVVEARGPDPDARPQAGRDVRSPGA